MAASKKNRVKAGPDHQSVDAPQVSESSNDNASTSTVAEQSPHTPEPSEDSETLKSASALSSRYFDSSASVVRKESPFEKSPFERGVNIVASLITIVGCVISLIVAYVGEGTEVGAPGYFQNFVADVYLAGTADSPLARFLVFLTFDAAFAYTFSLIIYQIVRHGGLSWLFFPAVIGMSILQSAVLIDVLWYGSDPGSVGGEIFFSLISFAIFLDCLALFLHWIRTPKSKGTNKPTRGWIAVTLSATCAFGYVCAAIYFGHLTKSPGFSTSVETAPESNMVQQAISWIDVDIAISLVYGLGAAALVFMGALGLFWMFYSVLSGGWGRGQQS